MDFISFSTCWKTQRNMLQQNVCNLHSFQYFMLQMPSGRQISFLIVPTRAQCSERNHYACFEPNQKQRSGKPALGTDILRQRQWARNRSREGTKEAMAQVEAVSKQVTCGKAMTIQDARIKMTMVVLIKHCHKYSVSLYK